MSLAPNLIPTSFNERINSVDIIRGIALLGILLMNITGFGLSHAYFDPTISGGATGLNLKAWWMTSMFFEGTMRGMFSMLFGAGIVLFTSRAETTTNGVSVTDAYFRRLLWLFLFGVIHAYLLLWDGEILYPYAIIGMFAFAFRKLQPKHLIMAAILLLSASTLLAVKDYVQTGNAYSKATTAQAKKDAGQQLNKDETKAIEDWEGKVKSQKPDEEIIKEDIAARNSDYFSIVMYKAPMNQTMQTLIMYRYFFWDIFAMMLFGMALLKNGVLKAEKSNTHYVVMVIVGYGVGLTVNYMETSYLISNNFSILAKSVTDMSYDLGRIFTTLGHIGLIMLFIKSNVLGFLKRSLAAVGQMAFTNYISQTLICNTIFLGIGFGMYGKLQRYELYYVVFSVWLFQLIISPIWLKYFRFGPLEWAWRSLTYWEKQPFLK